MATGVDAYISLDGGIGSTLDFEYNVNGGAVGRATLKDKDNPYRIDRTAPGSAYTFSDNINLLSIVTLSEASIITLPSNPNYTAYIVKDKSGEADKFPITVVAEGGKTINGEENFIINIGTKPSITFIWDGLEYITV
jgi:hypothetical protein